MGFKKHFSQSVSGALKNWTDRDWARLAAENKTSVNELKDYFWSALEDGKRVLPIGEPCEGFSYKTGCPGHEVKDENAAPET